MCRSLDVWELLSMEVVACLLHCMLALRSKGAVVCGRFHESASQRVDIVVTECCGAWASVCGRCGAWVS